MCEFTCAPVYPLPLWTIRFLPPAQCSTLQPATHPAEWPTTSGSSSGSSSSELDAKVPSSATRLFPQKAFRRSSQCTLSSISHVSSFGPYPFQRILNSNFPPSSLLLLWSRISSTCTDALSMVLRCGYSGGLLCAWRLIITAGLLLLRGCLRRSLS